MHSVLDLKAELAVSSKVNPATKTAIEEANDEFKENSALERNIDAVDNATNTTPLQIRDVRDRLNGRIQNQNSSPNANFTPNPALTPSARISALNIVGDLLRKVGVSFLILAIERFFAFLLVGFTSVFIDLSLINELMTNIGHRDNDRFLSPLFWPFYPCSPLIIQYPMHFYSWICKAVWGYFQGLKPSHKALRLKIPQLCWTWDLIRRYARFTSGWF